MRAGKKAKNVGESSKAQALRDKVTKTLVENQDVEGVGKRK